MLMLGDMYHDGAGVKKDLNKAISWYKKAANKGLAHAQYSVGAMSATGYGATKPNLKKAKVWLQKAAKQGHKGAQAALKQIATQTKK